MHSTTRHSGPPAPSPGLSIVDLLDQVRSEHEASVQQLAVATMAQREAERKLQAQVVEMEQMRQVLRVLESSHQRIRQQYEDELVRLRRQLDSAQHAQPAKRFRSQADATRQAGDVRPPAMNEARPISPVGVGAPVQAASRSLRQLHIGAPQIAVLPPMHLPQPPLQIRPLNPTSATPTKRRTSPIPSIADIDPTSKGNVASESHSNRSSPVAKKPKTFASSSPNISNGKPTPLPTPTNDSRGSASDASPSSTASRSSRNGKTVTPPRQTTPDSKSSVGTTDAASTTSTSTSSVAASKSSTAKGGKLNWICAYSNPSSPQHDAERPVIELRHTIDHRSVVCCVRFSPDGSTLATGCHKTALAFDVETGKQKLIVNSDSADNAAPREDDSGHVRAIAFSPDSTKIAVGMPQSAVRVWDIATKAEGPVLTGHDSEVYALDWANDLIASGSGDKKIRLWGARTGSCRKVIGSESRGPSDGVTSVVFSPDGRYLAASSLDKVVRVWDTESSQLVDRFEGHSDSVYSIAFSPDGRQLVSGSFDKTIMLWEVNSQGRTSSRPRMVLQGHKDFVLSIAYTPDGRLEGPFGGLLGAPHGALDAHAHGLPQLGHRCRVLSVVAVLRDGQRRLPRDRLELQDAVVLRLLRRACVGVNLGRCGGCTRWLTRLW